MSAGDEKAWAERRVRGGGIWGRGRSEGTTRMDGEEETLGEIRDTE
jgi:hypothetical protein